MIINFISNQCNKIYKLIDHGPCTKCLIRPICKNWCINKIKFKSISDRILDISIVSAIGILITTLIISIKYIIIFWTFLLISSNIFILLYLHKDYRMQPIPEKLCLSFILVPIAIIAVSIASIITNIYCRFKYWSPTKGK